MLSNQLFRILRLFMHHLCTILGHDISNNRSTPQGSEWSAEDWTGLLVRSKVKSSPMVEIRLTGQSGLWKPT